MHEPLTYSAVEAAEKLGVSVATVYRMIDEGRLKTVILNKQRRVPLSELVTVTTPTDNEVSHDK